MYANTSPFGNYYCAVVMVGYTIRMCLQTKGEKAAEEGKVEQSIGIVEAKEVGVINTFVCENCVALTM